MLRRSINNAMIAWLFLMSGRRLASFGCDQRLGFDNGHPRAAGPEKPVSVLRRLFDLADFLDRRDQAGAVGFDEAGEFG